MDNNPIAELKADLGDIPKDLRKQLRPGLRAAGRVVADDAKLRASWSTRIPGATRVRVAFSGRRPGVSVTVLKNRAPHARAYEDAADRNGFFRHPVYGHDVWVSQKSRPFLFPALVAKGGEAVDQIGDVVDRVTREAGFR